MRRAEQEETLKNNDHWATIKLPEILSGMTYQDFRKLARDKKHSYKASLDLYQADHGSKTDVFEGMSD